MKKFLLWVLLIVMFSVDPGAKLGCAEQKDNVFWQIDFVIAVDPLFASSVNENSQSHPDPERYTCVWVMGWMNIPYYAYYSLDYSSVNFCQLPHGVILETTPAVQDQNKSRTILENGMICDQVGVIVYIEKKYDVVERLDLLFSSQNLSMQINNQTTSDTLEVFPFFKNNHAFDDIPFLDLTEGEWKAETIIESISPVSEEMAIQRDFHDLLRYISDGYQCWIVRFRVVSNVEHLPMKSFYVQTREREQSFILSKGEYAFLGSFMEGDHIENGCVDAFLITKPTPDEERISIIENMLLNDELTLYLAPTYILLSDGLFELNTPWVLRAPLRSNDGNWKLWQ